MNTREKPKKNKQEQTDKEHEQKQSIPDNLYDVPEPKEQEQEEPEPPKPISMQGTKGDVLKPARLPPRFKEKFQSSPVKTEEPTIKPVEQEKPESTGQTVKNESSSRIRPPVTIRQRRESIPSPIKQEETKPVQPTRIELEEAPVVQNVTTKQQTSRSISDLAEETKEDPILKQFNIEEILKRPKEKSWPWKTARTVKIPGDLESYWKIEASLYSAIAMLHFFTVAYENGDVAQEVYSKQLKSQLLEAIQLRFKLEKDKKFNWESFVKENKLEELFAEGVEKLARVTGSSDIDAALDEETIKIDYHEMKKLPTKAADYVSNAIELMDLIRLQSVATVERLIPLLEDMKKIIISINIFDADYWAIKEIDLWITKLYHMQPGSIPSDEELERFEMYVVRWMNDFRRELKNI